MSEEEIQVEITSDNAGGEDNPAVSELIRQKEALEQQLRSANERAAQAERSSQANYANSVDQYLQAAEQNAVASKEAVKAALESGDWQKMADAQESLSLAAARIAQYEGVKANLQNQQRQQQPSDPVERMAQGRTERAAAWIREHPEWVRDQNKLEQLDGAHKLAKAQHPEGSDAYFNTVDSLLGISKGSKQSQPRNEANGQYTRRNVAPVAPVTNFGNGMSGHGSGPQSVKLSPNEVSLAEDTFKVTAADVNAGWAKREEIGQPLGRVRFAKRKLAMMRSGAYDRRGE